MSLDDEIKQVLCPGDVVDGRYKVISHLQDGTYGPLYIVEHIKFPARFVLKLNLPSDTLPVEQYTGHQKVYSAKSHLERTVNEVTLLARFNHPHVIKVIDQIDNVGGKCSGFVTEQVRNVKTLADVIGDRRHKLRMSRRLREIQQQGKRKMWGRRYGQYKFDDDAVVDYIRQLQRGVEHIRAEGYLHKDLKPENVLVDSDAVLKIIDFGMACPVDEGNGLFANRLYAPPEFRVGRQHKNSDLWSLSVIALEVMTGGYLFGRKDKDSVKQRLDFSKRENIGSFWKLASSIYFWSEFARYVESSRPNRVANIYRMIKMGLSLWPNKRHNDTWHLTKTPMEKTLEETMDRILGKITKDLEERKPMDED